VQVLAALGEKILMARQGNLLVAAFHPELTADLRVHEYFLQLCRKWVADGNHPAHGLQKYG
jgi:5'-phosphate synthase pdxT subunit